MKLRYTVCTLAAAAVAAWTATAQAAEKKVVKFLAAQYSPATDPYWAGLEKAFEAAHPDIDLQVEVSYWKGLHDKITTLIGAKQQPDLAIIGTSWLPEYVETGVARAVDDSITPEFAERFSGSILDGARIGGKTYGLPIATSVRALFYNKKMFADAGLQPPANWEEFKKAAETLTQGRRRFGTCMAIHPDDQGDAFTYFLWGAGGDWFSPEGECLLASPEAVEALEFMLALYKAGATNPEPWASNRDETQRLFITGRAAMVMTGNFLVPILKKDNPELEYGVTAIPSHRKPGTLAITDTLVFFNREGQEADAVWKFIEFAYQAEWREKFMRDEGMLPELKELAAKVAEEPEFGPFVKLLPTAKFQPNHRDFVPISQRLVKAVQLTLLGQEEPKAALEKSVAEINREFINKERTSKP